MYLREKMIKCKDDKLWKDKDIHFIGVAILILAMVLVIFIYMVGGFNTMEAAKDCNTLNPNMAQTKSVCIPKVYTSFGGLN